MAWGEQLVKGTFGATLWLFVGFNVLGNKLLQWAPSGCRAEG